MSFEVLVLLVAIVLLIGLSAFFNMSETALTASSRPRMHTLAQDGDHRAKLVNKLMQSPERVIGAVLLGSTLVDVLAASLATTLALTLIGKGFGELTASIVMTVLIVIFAAVLPKTYALAEPDRVSLFVAPIMRGVIVILLPATIAIQHIVRWLLRLTPSTKDDAANILESHQELRGTIELGQRDGGMQKNDAHMLGGILDLSDLQVLDVMVHRTKIEAVNADEPNHKIIDAILKSQYTRVPIWKDEPENIVGVLHTKDLLVALGRNGWDIEQLDIMGFAAKPWFVPDTTSVRDQLNQFLKQKQQMALVVDEYGEVQGLITLEDILEEIVGQIADEHDTHETAIRPLTDGTVNVDGTVAIRDLNRHMDWDLPDEEATTIVGLVIHEAQMIPEPGQAFTFHGYRFEVLRKSRNKIKALRIKPMTPVTSADGENDAMIAG